MASTTPEPATQGFVLVEPYASVQHGRTMWFKQMTAIGPMTTPNVEERRVFATEAAAYRCPAMLHMLTHWNVVPVQS